MSKDEISEGEWLDQYSDFEDEPIIEYSNLGPYLAAKNAKVGETVKCGCGCGRKFKKKSYQQAFFRNKGRNNCKDNYYNRTPERVERTLIFSGIELNS